MQKSTKRNAQGGGSLRQLPSGRWQGRYTVGRDPGTGKQIQKSIYADTQQEARKLITAAIAALDEGTYLEPSTITVAQWLDHWLKEYTHNLKPYTIRNYRSQVERHLKPYLGAVKVSALTPDMIQRVYNRLASEEKLSSKTIRNVHGILHSAFEALVDIGEIRVNPCTVCGKRLPRVERKELHPLADDDMIRFMDVIKGSDYECLFLVDLFTGLHQGELLGLRWSCVDFKRGSILIDRQLYAPDKGGEYTLQELKNRKSRTIYPAPFVFDTLKRERQRQRESRLLAGSMWREDIPDLVFTNTIGGHLVHNTVYYAFKRMVTKAGVPAVHFHDMRHSYAVSSLRSGDDVKTVQENLGHASAAFTLDQYAFATDMMKRESALRMQEYIESLPK